VKVARRARNSLHLPMTVRVVGFSISGSQFRGKITKRKEAK